MTAAQEQAAARERVLARLASIVPALDQRLAARIADRAKVRGRSWVILDQHLQQRPEALSRPGADFPPALVRLAHVLVDAGYAGITLPACAGCGKVTVHLERRIPEGRGCSNCYGRHKRGFCARCQRRMRIYARRPDGDLCGTCVNKEKATECDGCGRVRPPAARLPDGSVRCQGCAARPLHRCVSCGEDAPAQSFTEPGAVCRRCYLQPTRQCGQCGRIRRIYQRAQGDRPDLCASCYRPPTATCSVCGRTRPCHRVSTGRPICLTCKPRPRRPCARCSRTRPVQAEWPLGPVCRDCYEFVRRNPRPCDDCHESRPLVGTNRAGKALCGPCAGTDLLYACHRCGTSGDLFREHCCARCILTERVTDLLTSDDGTMIPELRQVHQALTRAERPRHLLNWLESGGVPRLLAGLAAAAQPITHQQLDEFPNTRTARYARDLLVAADVLPARDDDLARLPDWVDQLLAQVPAPHRQIATPFAHWHLLRRLRSAHRRGARGTGPNSATLLRSRLRRTLELLAWLDQHERSLPELTQAELERWLDEGATTRRHIRAFITWARSRSLIGDIVVPLPARADPVTFIDEDERVQHLRRCLNDEELPLWLRVAGALILLFGLQGTRVLRLSREDVDDDGVIIHLNIHGRQLRLPPKLGHLVRRLRDQDEPRGMLHQLGSSTCWLIPGQSPARPLSAQQLGNTLRQHGLGGLAARNTARLALAADLPASVLADLTGTSVENAVHWTTIAKRDWGGYIASRQQNPLG